MILRIFFFFYSLTAYCYSLFNVPAYIYLEGNFNVREHVQAQKLICLKANLPRPKFWPSKDMTEGKIL